MATIAEIIPKPYRITDDGSIQVLSDEDIESLVKIVRSLSDSATKTEMIAEFWVKVFESDVNKENFLFKLMSVLVR